MANFDSRRGANKAVLLHHHYHGAEHGGYKTLRAYLRMDSKAPLGLGVVLQSNGTDPGLALCKTAGDLMAKE